MLTPRSWSRGSELMQSTISVGSISTKSRWEATPRHEFMETGIEASTSMS
ncbi:hypothetical protein E2C01_076869 [Portunus trituberculatus]|uniref:Uncharacterized protein n=1 Tax=Portunus trituberculatus TaxID=210409 RepID=A0A5B7IJP8_PORTR|nr:hypothetical protein [Portunus trituberculatus]